MKYWLVLLVLVTASVCQEHGERRINGKDSTVKENVASSAENSDAGQRGTWSPRDRTCGWGRDKHAPALRIKDEDRQAPARHRPEWIEWRKTYGAARTYHNVTDEELHARVFEESELMVAENQEAFAKGEALYELGINQFADLTEEDTARFRMNDEAVNIRNQFYAKLNGTKETSEADLSECLRAQRPNNFDWRDHIKLTPVKDQGTKCGSCYAFSAVAAVEAQYALHKNITVSLSEQFVMDCTENYKHGYNDGCSGGFESIVYEWMKGTKRGLRTNDQYPYKAQLGTCPTSNHEEVYIIGNFMIASWGFKAEETLKRNIPCYGPITCGMYGYMTDFQMYKSGIYNNVKCLKEPIDHAIVAIGYGNERGIDYWTIRNSWGRQWGEDGYGKLARGINQCGFPDLTAWPIL